MLPPRPNFSPLGGYTKFFPLFMLNTIFQILPDEDSVDFLESLIEENDDIILICPEQDLKRNCI